MNPGSLAYCTICDCDRTDNAKGEERDGDWICADCLETEPCLGCGGEHHHASACGSAS